MRSFLRMWVGQAVSLLGSAMSSFALELWVYQTTGSTTQFAAVALCANLPGILASAVLGDWVDRAGPKRTLVGTSFGYILSACFVAWLAFGAHLSVAPIYALVCIRSLLGSGEWLAMNASIGQLLPKPFFGRASGLLQLGQALAQTIGPLAAGALISRINLGWFATLDLAGAVFSLLMLLSVRFGEPPAAKAGAEAVPYGERLASGWRFLRARPALVALLALFAAGNFLTQLVIVLATPLVLGFGTPADLGTVLSAAGLGSLAGGVFASVWRGPRSRVSAILAFNALASLFMMLAGLRASVMLVRVSAFAFLFFKPLVVSSSQAIWSSKVPLDVQGRVFAVRYAVAFSLVPLACLAAGPVTEFGFEPLLVKGGPLADTVVGSVLGSGPGRGVGLLFVTAGACSLALSAAAACYPRLRRLEVEVPDVIGGAPAAAPPAAAPAIGATTTSDTSAPVPAAPPPIEEASGGDDRGREAPVA